MQIAFPFRIGAHGQVAGASYDAHIRQMIEQVLFTAPGERVNRPEFGCGLGGFVFTAANNEMVTATQGMVHGELQQWLGDVIHVESVEVEAEEATLRVTIEYVVLENLEPHVAMFER